MDSSDSEEEGGPKKMQHPNRRKSYYVRFPDAEGSPYLFPPDECRIKGTPPNGEKYIQNSEAR